MFYICWQVRSNLTEDKSWYCWFLLRTCDISITRVWSITCNYWEFLCASQRQKNPSLPLIEKPCFVVPSSYCHIDIVRKRTSVIGQLKSKTYPRMLGAIIGCIGRVALVLREKNWHKLIMCFLCLISIYCVMSPWTGMWPSVLIILYSINPDILHCQACRFWKGFHKVDTVYTLFLVNFPSSFGAWTLIWTYSKPFTQMCFLPSWLKLI